MEWQQFSNKFGYLKDEFNNQPIEERERTSRLMRYEAIRELIRSKKHLKDAIAKINERIKQLSDDL